VLLRREFRGGCPGTTEAEPRVIVSFGGTDPTGLTGPMVGALLARLDPMPRLQVIVGSGVPAEVHARLEQLADQHEQLELHVDVRDMSSLLCGASLCVSAAGTTVWEAMACGVPVAIIGVADNQRAVVEGIERRAAGVCLGWHDTLDVAAAADEVHFLLADPPRLAELASKGRATVDGRGVYRVLDALLDVIDNRA
jgi:spore coat polysaccharide biosynthesis predicted glycosyltransferase SpsG